MVASRSFLPLTLLPLLTAAYTYIDNPAVGGDNDNGWTELPPVPGADLISDWPVDGTDSTFVRFFSLFLFSPLKLSLQVVYQSSGLDNSAITRAIIVPGAKVRQGRSMTVKSIAHCL